MKWRFVDSIDRFEPWTRIKGRKSVSLEEYEMLIPLGRKGVLPESLVLESAVHLTWWLVAKSSDFEWVCLLAGVERFVFENEAGVGDTLATTINVQERDQQSLTITCESVCGPIIICRGSVLLSLIPLGLLFDCENIRLLWRELYAEAS